MSKILILGYGNPDREDDGVAWHIQARLAGRLGRPVPASYQDEFDVRESGPDFLFDLQLMPEMSELVAEYDRVCLIDAHTGSVPELVQLQVVVPEYQSSPLTHHLTPQALMSLVKTLYQRTPEVILVSVRGYRFGFSNDLSPETSLLADQAVEQILDWLMISSR